MKENNNHKKREILMLINLYYLRNLAVFSRLLMPANGYVAVEVEAFA